MRHFFAQLVGAAGRQALGTMRQQAAPLAPSTWVLECARQQRSSGNASRGIWRPGCRLAGGTGNAGGSCVWSCGGRIAHTGSRAAQQTLAVCRPIACETLHQHGPPPVPSLLAAPPELLRRLSLPCCPQLPARPEAQGPGPDQEAAQGQEGGGVRREARRGESGFGWLQAAGCGFSSGLALKWLAGRSNQHGACCRTCRRGLASPVAHELLARRQPRQHQQQRHAERQRQRCGWHAAAASRSSQEPLDCQGGWTSSLSAHSNGSVRDAAQRDDSPVAVGSARTRH